MTYPTDTAIEAAEGEYKWSGSMKAALIAARAAEPMPSLAEFAAAALNLCRSYCEFMDAEIGVTPQSRAFNSAYDALLDLFRRATGEGVGE